jgi:2',3'-cyclic-nucleotide 2'-phosphodiesterase (5'-nucleotidase family)
LKLARKCCFQVRIKKEIENLTTAIAKEKHASKNLEFLTVSVEAAQEEIKQLQQENILRLTHLSSKLAAEPWQP